MANMDALAFALERSFLASEFLTWLWFSCEVEGGEFDLPEGRVSLAVEDSLALSSFEDEGLKASLRGGMPTLRPEAANALACGLLLKKAKLLLALGPKEWSFTLDGETLDLRSVKLSDPEGEDDEPEDALAEKLLAGEELRGLVDGLFARFLGLRLGDDWERLEVPRMRGWVRDKVGQAWARVGAA